MSKVMLLPYRHFRPHIREEIDQDSAWSLRHVQRFKKPERWRESPGTELVYIAGVDAVAHCGDQILRDLFAKLPRHKVPKGLVLEMFISSWQKRLLQDLPNSIVQR